jgi:hypothetical protein
VRCAAALVLALLMGAAIYEFGSIDAVGHLPIIVILVAVVAEGAGNWKDTASARSVMLAPIAKGLALVSVAFSYNAAHHWFVGPQSPQVITDTASVQGPEEHPHREIEALAAQPDKESAHLSSVSSVRPLP